MPLFYPPPAPLPDLPMIEQCPGAYLMLLSISSCSLAMFAQKTYCRVIGGIPAHKWPLILNLDLTRLTRICCCHQRSIISIELPHESQLFSRFQLHTAQAQRY